MLIKALSEYYDILAAAGKVLPDGYSYVNVHYLVCLTPDGKLDEIIDIQQIVEEAAGKGKIKQRKVPKKSVMPQRTEKTATDVNIPEHRSLYLFGLNLSGEQLTPEDPKGKAQKSHQAFVRASLEFLDGIDSPLIQAYRRFVQDWEPKQETRNPHLLQLGKSYGKSGFAFCLSGAPDRLLHDEQALKEKWERLQAENTFGGEYISQCAVSGQRAPIARIHSNVKNVPGGTGTGNKLVCYNNPSENSYGNKQAYNSNISETVMKKYTEALNYLLEGRRHKVTLDDVTIVFWAMNPNENCEDLFMRMFLGQSDQMNAEETENMLRALWKDAAAGHITEGRLQALDQIQPDVDFYMLGLKPDSPPSSRLSMKFLIHRQFADILWNVVQFQKDLQMGSDFRPVYLWEIKREMISPKSSQDKVNPALLTKLFESVIYGSPYPVALLETMVRRVKTDSGKINAIRTGVIKACINRNDSKEELKVALDRENKNQAYLCGRLFAVLEKLQQDASGGGLNRTIKDAYFASAAAKPALVFPKLIILAQNHLKKVKYPVFYSKQIQEITEKLTGEFPDTLLLKDQGRFIVGYYQQYQSFFETQTNKNNMEEK